MEALDYFMGGRFFQDYYALGKKIVVPQDVRSEFCALFIEYHKMYKQSTFDIEEHLEKYYGYNRDLKK